MKVFSSRNRVSINDSGEKETDRIRRLRCVACGKTHSELPDLFIPYKRHQAKSVERIIDDPKCAVAVDERTCYRWKRWFRETASYLANCLVAIAARLGKGPVEEESDPPQPAHQRLGQLVGAASGWLARVVRSIVNANLWVHTRSAVLTTAPFARVQSETRQGRNEYARQAKSGRDRHESGTVVGPTPGRSPRPG